MPLWLVIVIVVLIVLLVAGLVRRNRGTGTY